MDRQLSGTIHGEGGRVDGQPIDRYPLDRRRPRVALTALALAAAAALAAGGVLTAVMQVVRAVGSRVPDPDRALLAALAGLGWFALLAAIGVVSGHTWWLIVGTRPRSGEHGPAPWAARIAACLVGVAVPAGAAHAAPAPGYAVTAPQFPAPSTDTPSTDTHSTGSPATVLRAPDPRWNSGATNAPHAPDIRLVGGRSAEAEETEVVVRRGECLWDIVARHLGTQASSAQIAAEWPRWYAANRTAIGADPDLIRPGLVLRIPQARS